MGEVVYAATTGGRFQWHELGDDQAERVVAFDTLEGATHCVHTLTLSLHQLLERCPQGLSLPQMIEALDLGTPEDGLIVDAVSELLSAMMTIGMVRRVDTVFSTTTSLR